MMKIIIMMIDNDIHDGDDDITHVALKMMMLMEMVLLMMLNILMMMV